MIETIDMMAWSDFSGLLYGRKYEAGPSPYNLSQTSACLESEFQEASKHARYTNMHLPTNAFRAAVVAALAVAVSASLGDRLPDFKECVKVQINHLRQKLLGAYSEQLANTTLADMYGN